MSNGPFLFIGGVADGQVFSTDLNELTVGTPHVHSLLGVVGGSDPGPVSNYRKESIVVTNGPRAEVFVECEMSSTDALLKLIRSYHRG